MHQGPYRQWGTVGFAETNMSRKLEKDAFPGEGLSRLKGSLEAMLTESFSNGVWDQPPWFCEEEDPWFGDAGFSLARRRELLVPLRQLYPPEVCRRLLKRPLDAALLFGLFQRMPGFLIPLLHAASDRAVLGSLEGAGLLGKLRSRGEFAAAASELSIWADLVRAGYDVDREPGVLVDGSVRRPDFGVREGGDYFYIEASRLLPGSWERAADRLEQELSVQPNITLKGRAVRFRPSGDFLNGAAEVLASLFDDAEPRARHKADKFIAEHITPAVNSALAAVVSAGSVPGTYGIEGVGELLVSDDGQTQTEIELMPPPPVTDVAQRVWRKIVEEARQLAPGSKRVARGVIVIDLGRAAQVLPVADALAALLSKGRPEKEVERMAAVDAILLRGGWIKPGGGRTHAVHLLTVSREEPTPGLVRLARAIGGGFLVSRRGGGELQGEGGEQFRQES